MPERTEKMSWEDAQNQVEDQWGGRKDFAVEFCRCSKGEHEWMERALGEVEKAVLASLDDPGDLRDSYDYERYKSLVGAVSTHTTYGHNLVLARDGEELLGAACFRVNFTYAWSMGETSEQKEGLLQVADLGTTGTVKGVGKELMTWLGAVALLMGQEVALLANPGSEKFYEKLGMGAMIPGHEAAHYLWRTQDLPGLEAAEIGLGTSSLD